MKTIFALGAAACVFAFSTASACEWMKSAKVEQSVKAPTSTTVATLAGQQSTPAKPR